MRRWLVIVLAIATGAGTACRRPPAPTPEVVAIRAAAVPDDPADPVWEQAPEHVARLLLQDLVEPRLLQPSTPDVRVRAISNGVEVAFRLEWTDTAADDTPGAGRFMDACAIQLPLVADVTAPDPQMGQAGRGVQITYWRADWQASVNGRPDSIAELYPNASIDHYPFDAPPAGRGSAQADMARRYAPADAVGNRRAGPRSSSVEDLVAEGPGTIDRAPAATSRGRGVRTETGWAVVIVRPMPDGLAARSRTQVAFAVWQGSAHEAGARKMRSAWVGLSMRELS